MLTATHVQEGREWVVRLTDESGAVVLEGWMPEDAGRGAVWDVTKNSSDIPDDYAEFACSGVVAAIEENGVGLPLQMDRAAVVARTNAAIPPYLGMAALDLTR